MKRVKRFLAVIVSLALLALTAVYLTPLDTYVPEAERVLSAGLGEPVKIKHLGIGTMPVPHLVLENVQAGEKPGISLQTVKVMFDFRTLFDSQRVIHRMVLSHGSVTQAQVEKLYAALQSSIAASPFRMDELQFDGIRYDAPQFSLESVGGRVIFAPDNSLEYARLALPDKKVVITLRPQSSNTFAVEAKFNKWPLPNYPDIQLGGLSTEGVLAWPRLDIKKFSAEAYGAHMEGHALLEWKPEWKMALWLDSVTGKAERLPSVDKSIVLAGDLRGKGNIDAHGATVQALLDNLKFDASVEIQNATVHVPGSFHQPLVLDEIKTRLSGTLAEHTLTGLQGKLYGGVAEGSAVIHTQDAQLQADIVFNNIAIGPVVEALSSDVVLTGTLGGKAKLAINTKEAGHFLQKLKLDGEFRVGNGVLHKMDMVQAAGNPLKKGDKTGKTSFDELSGLLSVDASGYHFRRLKVSSGALNAEGRLDISPQLQLDGALDTDVKRTAGLISMPLAVSGSLDNPVLRPTKSALAGASVGTALMGPGLGTALGIKAGNLLNKLFGKKNEKADEDKPKK